MPKTTCFPVTYTENLSFTFYVPAKSEDDALAIVHKIFEQGGGIADYIYNNTDMGESDIAVTGPAKTLDINSSETFPIEFDDLEELDVLDYVGTIFNDQGTNALISYKILDKETMEHLGFRYCADQTNPYWLYSKAIDNETSCYMRLPNPEDNDNLCICALDEAVLQPYNYERVLKNHPEHRYALEVKAAMEEYVMQLQGAGVLSGFKAGMYI